MGDYDHPDLAADGAGRRPWLTVGAVVLALVVGIAAGFLLGGGTSRSSPVGDVAVGPEAAPSPPPTESTPAGAEPPQPCLAAGVAATEVLQELETAVAAIGALDPTALRGVLDRLQPVQGELEGAVAACDGRLGPAPPPAPPTSAPPPTG